MKKNEAGDPIRNQRLRQAQEPSWLRVCESRQGRQSAFVGDAQAHSQRATLHHCQLDQNARERRTDKGLLLCGEAWRERQNRAIHPETAREKAGDNDKFRL